MDPKQTVSRNGDEESQNESFDYTTRAQWLRAAVLGANDGLVSTASLMVGVGAVKKDVKEMILTGFAGLVAGACSMAIGEFVMDQNEKDEEKLPNPLQAAIASALAFSVGAMVPLLAASFVRDYKVRVGVVVAAVTMALAFFGWFGAFLGGAPVFRASFRVLVGGWFAMAITFGLTKWMASIGF
ncbi:Vacuolar iron transporter-like protein 4 [Bienertia sinuspersici]